MSAVMAETHIQEIPAKSTITTVTPDYSHSGIPPDEGNTSAPVFEYKAVPLANLDDLSEKELDEIIAMLSRN